MYIYVLRVSNLQLSVIFRFDLDSVVFLCFSFLTLQYKSLSNILAYIYIYKTSKNVIVNCALINIIREQIIYSKHLNCMHRIS